MLLPELLEFIFPLALLIFFFVYLNIYLDKITLKGGFVFMKKIISISLISLSLLLSLSPKLVSAVNIFEEGVYKATDFSFSSDNNYIVQNISKENSAFIQLFDENQNLLQSIHLSKNSDKYNLLPLKPDYRIVIVGKGDVFISS